MSRSGGIRAVVAIAAALSCATVAVACSVPVFRYALERWRPDPYVVYVFHEGPLSDEQSALLTRLDGFATDSNPANVYLLPVDVAKPIDDEDLAKAWQAHRDAPARDGRLPWVVARFPYESSIRREVHAGPLSATTVDALLTSPARTALAKRLLAGDSAVWLLLKSGDADRDAAAETKLNLELTAIRSKLKLPEILPEDGRFISQGGPQLKIAFSVLPVDRADPREATLTKIVTSAEPRFKAEELAGPIVVPVFGRGRALAAFTPEDVTPALIADVSEFLVGPCSCEVKEQNPGFDLLLGIDWDASITARSTIAETIPDLTSPLAAFHAPTRETGIALQTAARPAATNESPSAATKSTPTADAATAEPAPVVTSVPVTDSVRSGSSLGRNLLIGLALVLPIVFAASAAVRRG